MEGLPGQHLFSAIIITIIIIIIIIILILILIIIIIIVIICSVHHAHGQLAQHHLHHPLQHALYTLWLYVTAILASTTHVRHVSQCPAAFERAAILG